MPLDIGDIVSHSNILNTMFLGKSKIVVHVADEYEITDEKRFL